MSVVFAYHSMGVRCLSVLLAHGQRPHLVITHRDDAQENVWFPSVAKLATEECLPWVYAEDTNVQELTSRLTELSPDFIFSFYYRHLLPEAILRTARRGAYNMHGSLLPQFRGRAPVNWAIAHGATQTGATLHAMTTKADAGDIFGQQAVAILPNDEAQSVQGKVVWAAESLFHRCLPQLLAGTLKGTPQDLSQGSYFGRRKPEDGLIQWRNQSAQQIHNLVRAVAPPYPGAYTMVDGHPLRVLRSRLTDKPPSSTTIGIYSCQAFSGRADHPDSSGTDAALWCYADCADGRVLRLVSLEWQGQIVDGVRWRQIFGPSKISPHLL